MKTKLEIVKFLKRECGVTTLKMAINLADAILDEVEPPPLTAMDLRIAAQHLPDYDHGLKRRIERHIRYLETKS